MMKISKELQRSCLLAWRPAVGFSMLLFAVTTPMIAEAVDDRQADAADKAIGSDKVTAAEPLAAGIASAWALHAEQWELARDGEAVLSLPVLDTVMNAWLEDRSRSIEIQYPGGEEGEFWVQQLTDWLVSLGVPSSAMVTVPGSGADDVIRFHLVRNF